MHSHIRRIFALALALSFTFLLQRAQAAVATDPNDKGPFAVTSSEYKLRAKADPEIDPSTVTELWARIYRPADLGGVSHPLIVMLHGNHSTCGHYVDGVKGRVDDDSTYTYTGTCPDGYVVVPSHEGYAYVASRLASWGYVVVSVNANRGINAAGGVDGDWGLNLRRGRLVLRHLQQLDKWNTKGGAPASLGFDLQGVLDFSQIGLMGHSRGGEGMIAAYTLYHDTGSPWPARFHNQPQIRGIFELAPVDGQTSRTFTADNVPWNVLLPLCDGDVSDLEGVKVYDRTIEALAETTPGKKSVYAVWGANHNFYNSQWQQSDSFGCAGAGNQPLFTDGAMGSPSQRLTGSYGMMAFFRGHVGSAADPAMAELLNSSFKLPATLEAASTFERSFAESAAQKQNAVVEAFTGAVGFNSSGAPNDLSNIDMSHGGVPDHDWTLAAGAISWDASGHDAGTVFFQTNWTTAGTGKVVDAYQTLEFRVAEQAMASAAKADAADFSIALADSAGNLSASVSLKDYAKLYAPVGEFYGHPILETVRVPLKAFGLAAGTPVHGVRFIFDGDPQGAIYLSDVRVSRPIKAPAAGADTVAGAAGASGGIAALAPARPVVAKGVVASIRASRPAGTGEQVEISLESRDQIPVRDALPVLRIGGKAFKLSRFPNRSSTFTIAFTMSRAEFDALPQSSEVVMEYGADRWSFGKLDKRLAQ